MPDTNATITLLNVTGDVRVRSGSLPWSQAKSGMTFPSGSVVVLSSGPDGKADILDSAGGKMTINPNSLLIIQKAPPKPSGTLPNVDMNIEEIKRGLDALRGVGSMVGVPCV